MASNEHNVGHRSPSRIPLPASPVAPPRQPKLKPRPPPLDLSMSKPTAYSSLASTGNVVPLGSCTNRASISGISTGNPLKYSNHYRQRRHQDLRPFLSSENIRPLTTATSASSTGLATSTMTAEHTRQAAEHDYFAHDAKSIDYHECSPLLHDSLASASPIFDESSMLSPLITPNQSFRLRPHERTNVADDTSGEIDTLTNPRSPEPVAEGTLARPSWSRYLQLHTSYMHRLVQRMEHLVEDYVESIVQWAMQRYGAIEPFVWVDQESGGLDDHEYNDDLLFPIGSMVTDWDDVNGQDEELQAVVVGEDNS